MAVWQVEFAVVPRRAVGAGGAPLTPGASAWSADARFLPDYRSRLAGVAAPARSSVAEREMWGEEEGNCVEVWSVGGRVSRVEVRVDVRRLDSRFGAALLLVVRAAGAVMVRRDGLVVEPSIDAYARALRTSAAWRFSSESVASRELPEEEPD